MVTTRFVFRGYRTSEVGGVEVVGRVRGTMMVVFFLCPYCADRGEFIIAVLLGTFVPGLATGGFIVVGRVLLLGRLVGREMVMH